MAYCFMINSEYMRCINLIERNELTNHHEKFKILIGQAYINMGCIGQAIKILEAKIEEPDVCPIECAVVGGQSSSDGGLGGAPSSGFGIGSSSNQSQNFNLNDLVDEMVEGQ